MQSVFKNIAYVFAGRGVSMILGFIANIFFIRLIGSVGRGQLSLIEASATLLFVIASLNISNGIVQFSSKKAISPQKLLGIGYSIFFISMLFVVVLMILSLKIKLLSFLIPVSDNIAYLFLTLFLFVAIYLRELYSAFLKGFQVFRDLYIASLIYSIAKVLLYTVAYLISLYKIYEFTVLQLMIAHVVLMYVFLFSTFLTFKRQVRVSPIFTFAKEDFLPIIRYSLIGFLMVLIIFLTRKIDLWIIDFSLNDELLGFYAVAISFADVVMQIPLSIRTVLFPYVAGADDSKEKDRVFGLISRFNFTLVGAVLFVLYFSTDYFFPLLYGEAMIPSIPILKILYMVVLVLSFKGVFQVYFMAENRQIVNIISNIITLIVILGASLVFIRRFGVEWMAYSVLLGQMAGTTFTYLVFQSRRHTGLLEFAIITRTDFKMIGKLINRKTNKVR